MSNPYQHGEPIRGGSYKREIGTKLDYKGLGYDKCLEMLKSFKRCGNINHF